MSMIEVAKDICEYVATHTIRGECECGRCFDKGNAPDPVGHTADMIFFKVAAANNPNRDEFIRLASVWPGTFGPCDVFDGTEHSYLEIESWIGDQGEAICFMGLGYLLGVFGLLTPRTMLKGIDDDAAMMMACAGLVTVVAKSEVAHAAKA